MQATNVLTKFEYPKIYFMSILYACTAVPFFLKNVNLTPVLPLHRFFFCSAVMQATNVLTKFEYPKIYVRSILHACTAVPYFHIFLRLHHCPIFYVLLFILLGLLQVILLGKKKYKVCTLIETFLMEFIVLLLLTGMVYLLCLASVLGQVRE